MNQPFEPVDCMPATTQPAPRRATRQVAVKWGGRVVLVGGDAPVMVQSMTNTDTADAIATAVQVKDLAQAGSEVVRITVNSPEAAGRSRGDPRAARPHGRTTCRWSATFTTTDTNC